MKAVPGGGTRSGRAALEAEQLARLRSLLKAIVPENAFCTARVHDCEAIRSLEDFTRLVPFTTKTELIEDQQAHPPYGSNPPATYQDQQVGLGPMNLSPGARPPGAVTRDSTGAVAVRSLVAAVGSALGFYAISGIWMPFNPQGLDYVKHFVYWTLAYLPAFAALLVRR